MRGINTPLLRLNGFSGFWHGKGMFENGHSHASISSANPRAVSLTAIPQHPLVLQNWSQNRYVQFFLLLDSNLSSIENPSTRGKTRIRLCKAEKYDWYSKLELRGKIWKEREKKKFQIWKQQSCLIYCSLQLFQTDSKIHEIIKLETVQVKLGDLSLT